MVLEVQNIFNITDATFTSQITALSGQLPPLREGLYGGIMEWMEDYAETEPGIEHAS